jgi:TolB protein
MVGAFPSWSPDGSRLIFIQAQGDPVHGPTQIMTCRIDGSQLRELTYVLFGVGAPRWSPNGRLIAYMQATPHGRWDLVRMRPDGSRKQVIVDGPGNSIDPAWAPDSRRLAFSSDRGRVNGFHSLYLIAASGGRPRRLTHSATEDYLASWRPNRGSIAISRRTIHWISDTAQ